MSYVVRDYDPNDPLDAERLAAMFNDFDNAWPGGFNRGVPDTAESVREDMRRKHRLAVCVVECDGELVGYCDLHAQHGQTEEAYIPLLGARLSHHGRGVGKMLLRELIRRATEMGFRQVTLGTWAGNLKAVPLYKKTGFHWEPETNVHMRNFIPSALTIPAGRAFFADRDWYTCFEREIEVAPDDVRWKGMKVYPYRFRDGDDFLNLTFDAAGHGLTALETPAYAVACSIPTEEAPAGETYPITWEITSHSGKPLDVVLLAEAEPGLELRVQERLVVERETTLTRELHIAPDARPKRDGSPAHRVRSTLLIDGQPVTLETGVQVVRPVEIHYNGQGLFPGRAEKIVVQLRSRVEHVLEGQLTLDAHPEIVCDPPAQPFTLPAQSWTQCAFSLLAKTPGVHYTQLRCDTGTTQASQHVALRALGHGDALASLDPVDEEETILESPTLLVHSGLRGGWMRIQNTVLGQGGLGLPLAELGPPFMDWRWRPPLHTARLEQTAQGTTVTFVAPSQEFPGLTVERSVSLAAGDLVRVVYRVVNTTDRPLPAQLRQRANAWLNGWIAYPTADGVIREPLRNWGEFPVGDTDILAQGAKLPESWAACEEDGMVCGVIWQGGPEEDKQWTRLVNLTFDFGQVPPHSVQEAPPLYIVCGGGSWETVRNWWRRLVQPSGTVEAHKPEPRRVLEVGTEPTPALLFHDREEVRLSLQNRRDRVESGTLRVTGGDGFQADPAEFTLESVNRDRPFTTDLRVTAPPAPAAGFLHVDLITTTTTHTFPVPVVRLGQGETVRVTEPETGQVMVDNGYLTLRVAPGFRGSLYALERGGVNHLFTAYPEARPFTWSNPWFGGVHPRLSWNSGDMLLARATFTGGPAERFGARGLRWQGVQVACDMTHKDWTWLRLEAEYLTLPGSNVVACLSRWINRTDARHQTGGGWMAWCQVGGTRANTAAHWEREGERRHRRRGGFSMDANAGPWCAVENPDSRDVLMLVSTVPGAHTDVDDMGEEGPHLQAAGSLHFEPGETRETLTWLVLGQGIDQMRAYTALAQLRRLP